LRLFRKLRRKLDYLEPEQIEQIRQAYLLALEAHRHQKRHTGEPYITHPVAVACILADMKLDHQSIMAALMHDTIEDTDVDKDTLIRKFGNNVADLVDGVSKLTQIEFATRDEAQAENFRKMVLAMSRDIRVILVKLSDRLHNMRTLYHLPAHKQQRIAKETLEIYAPIARRLGMRSILVELEEYGFEALHPGRSKIIKDAVRKSRGNRKRVLALIDKTLREGLVTSKLPPCHVVGREKHLYSIYRKMRNKHIPFKEIMDVYAFRIIVDSADTCYRALGLVHSLFKPVPERFKDYIAIPKANGYQSLHTTLFGPYGLPIEVQIRSTEMDHLASSGIAAHWIYKAKNEDIGQSQLRAQRWVKNLLELQKSSGTSLEFIESVKVDLFPDEVYVFTPKGKIMELPVGATAVDFAYGVHTDIGNSCVAVKIDRQLAPLSAVLSNGQTMEVITSSRGRPNPAWLDFVVTGKARSAIRHYLKNQQKSEAVVLGRQLLEKALNTLGIQYNKIPEPAFKFVLEEAKVKSKDDLLSEIGLGNRLAILTAERLADVVHIEHDHGVDALEKNKQAPLIVKGTEGMVLEFANCCNPIPGDPIVGILKRGKGIQVHFEKCKHITKLLSNPDNCVPLRWAEDVKGEFSVSVRIEVVNQRGILAVMALAVSDADGNIEDISVLDRDGQHYQVVFKLLVRNRDHLAEVIRSLRQVPNVIRLIRGVN
jgi:guanosine-3',5'-bis(diphosphate) 3'-pyrophosphohydrolase